MLEKLDSKISRHHINAENYSLLKYNSNNDKSHLKQYPYRHTLTSDGIQQNKYKKHHQFSSVQSLSRVPLFATPWTVTRQAPLSMGFSRQEYWSGLPFPSPGDLPDPGIKPRSPALQADALTSEPPGKPK